MQVFLKVIPCFFEVKLIYLIPDHALLTTHKEKESPRPFGMSPLVFLNFKRVLIWIEIKQGFVLSRRTAVMGYAPSVKKFLRL